VPLKNAKAPFSVVQQSTHDWNKQNYHKIRNIKHKQSKEWGFILRKFYTVPLTITEFKVGVTKIHCSDENSRFDYRTRIVQTTFFTFDL
jgi:hypothetical protein